MHRGASVDTDYYLILIHFKEKMSMGRKKKQKYDVHKLKNKETLRSFQETMAKSLKRRGIKDEEQV